MSVTKIDDFYATISKFGQAKPNRFECEVFLPALVASSARGQIPRDLNLRIVGASFPGKNIRTTTDENIYGPSYEVAQGLTYGEEVTLEFLLKQNHEERLDLGKVNMDRYATQKALDPDMHLGFHNVDISTLPSGGRFYPVGSKLAIRPAQVSEVRHFSTIDEGNLLDIEDKLNHIVKNCTRFNSGTKVLSYKDILEEDRIYILL